MAQLTPVLVVICQRHCVASMPVVTTLTVKELAPEVRLVMVGFIGAAACAVGSEIPDCMKPAEISTVSVRAIRF